MRPGGGHGPYSRVVLVGDQEHLWLQRIKFELLAEGYRREVQAELGGRSTPKVDLAHAGPQREFGSWLAYR
jgi:hypothetical protein